MEKKSFSTALLKENTLKTLEKKWRKHEFLDLFVPRFFDLSTESKRTKSKLSL